jgi:hypothetical protein
MTSRNLMLRLVETPSKVIPRRLGEFPWRQIMIHATATTNGDRATTLVEALPVNAVTPLRP